MNSLKHYDERFFANFDAQAIVRFWDEIELLAQLRQKNKGRQKLVVHDVPVPPVSEPTPFVLAHRVVKDIAVKAAALMGYNISYLPNWNLFDPDLEVKIAVAENHERRPLDPAELRRRCANRVARRIEGEQERIRRLGIFADWRGVYARLESRHEARLLDYFGLFLERGFLRKEAKPSYWCITCQSILTEQELVFRPRKSTAAYVLFPVRRGLEELGREVYLLVWVAELWMLPAGVAVAVLESDTFVAQTVEGRVLLAEKETAARLFGPAPPDSIRPVAREALLELTCVHPLTNEEIPVVASERGEPAGPKGRLLSTTPASADKGYPIRLEHNYRIVSIVDDAGRLTEEAGMFCGIPMFEVAQHIGLQLEATGLLAAQDNVEVDYPHCWICEQPAVFRPADRWLFGGTHQDLQRRALDEVEAIATCFPESCDRLVAQMREIPEWTASQQRVWSLPVPAFYCQKCGAQLDVERSVKTVRDFVAHKGTDAWFTATAEEVLPNDVVCPHCGSQDFRKDTSTISAPMLSLIFCLLNLEGRRESAAVGDIFIDAIPHHRWYGQFLLALLASKGHFPTQFVHFCDVSAAITAQELLDRTQLWELLDRPFGVDLLRLLVIAGFPDSVSLEEACRQVEEEAAVVRRTIAYFADCCGGVLPSGRVSGTLPPLFQAFAREFEQMANVVVESFSKYRFSDAWERVRCFAEPMRVLTAVCGGLMKQKRAATPLSRLRSLLAEWGVVYMKLVAPFLPTTVEHLWREAFAQGAVQSIFLTDWNYPVQLGGRSRRRALKAGTAPFSFSRWMAIAEPLRRFAEQLPEGAAVDLLLDDPQGAVLVEATRTELEAYLNRPVQLVRRGETKSEEALSLIRLTAGPEPASGEDA